MIHKEKNSIKYIFKKPEKYNKYSPLFLMIHGYGSNENNLFYFKKDIPNNFFIISLQGLYCIEENLKYYWYDINFSDKKKFINVEQAKNSINTISDFIDKSIEKYNLNCNQVWICGFSQGSIISYGIALKNKKVKKVISLSGYFDDKIIFSKENKYIDFFISHGKYDTIIPIDWARNGIKILNKNNTYSIFYKEYESGHELNEINYIDFINWIKKNNKQ
ncbi:alpha/beta hydrolase [Blattabacterium cuenoti]|uniref:alpha/beta hydrolase n=1 Tax=Blattabacterium cuenoti TaxID=1653831 RepID=UPI001EEAECF3|nr:phospholipase [Blattabacterium cuenoti]